ncbi:metallophosphoesterase [Niveibacterium sp.]|uniref:metallophosphoesterase family protein n=1 Tax=Niveibacterium sp. TaxID=2017444 RepID=UPI0035AF02AA
MRIAFVSDIHGNLPALEAVVADIRGHGADLIANLGDSLSGPLLPRETAQYLIAAGWPTLAGNHERQLLTQAPDHQGASDAYAFSQLGEAEFAWMRSQPGTLQLQPDVFVCHGTPASDLEYFFETLTPAGARIANAAEVRARLGNQRAPLVVCGHSHMPRMLRLDEQWLLNPGSVGLQAFRGEYPYPHTIETGSPDARYAIAEQRGSVWHLSLHAVPYDFESMAQLAETHGRPEWAQALRSGYIG